MSPDGKKKTEYRRPRPAPQAPPDTPRRSFARQPGRWEARLMISLPAILVLLVISMGLANYYVVYLISSDLESILAKFDKSTPAEVINPNAPKQDEKEIEKIVIEQNKEQEKAPDKTKDSPGEKAAAPEDDAETPDGKVKTVGKEEGNIETFEAGLKLKINECAQSGINRVLVLLLVFTVLAILCGVALVVTILLPLREMTEAAATIARGDVRKPINIRAGFELGQLGQSFNSMVDFINAMVEQRDAYFTEGDQTASMIVDARGNVVSIDRAGLEMLAAQHEEMIGKTLAEIQRERPNLAPAFFDFCAMCADALAEVATIEGASPVAGVIPDKPVEIPLERSHDDDRSRPQSLSVECSLLTDEHDAPTSIVFHFRDAAYLKNLNALFSRTDHLAALGTFTIGLSHELRNPLGALKGTTQLLEERIAERTDCLPYLNRIIREVDRLDLLVRELYDFSRSPLDVERVLDFNEIVREAFHRTLRGIDEDKKVDRRIEEHYAPDLGRVHLQEARVTRAISNVVINSFDHMPPGATLSFRTSALNDSSGARVALEIINSGSSIPKENLTKIFEPFFSTRQGGTGLGLAIAYQIVAQNRGQLSVSSEDDQTCFQFLFRKARPSQALTVENDDHSPD